MWDMVFGNFDSIKVVDKIVAMVNAYVLGISYGWHQMVCKCYDL